jgi:hypothetical protein
MKKDSMDANELRDYKKDPPVLNVTKTTLDHFKHENKRERSNLLALYIWYGYVTVWQNSRTIWAGVNYMSEITGWSPNKVRRVRKGLLRMGLIEDVQQRKQNGDFGKRYVRVHYFCVLPKTRSTRGGYPMCLVTDREVQLTDNLRDGRQSVRRMRDENPLIGKDNSFITRYAQKLHAILKLESRYQRAKIESYAKAIRHLLHTDGIEQERFKKVFKFYIKIGCHKQHCAKIYRVSDIVDNFLRIEDAMNRHINPPKKQTGDPEENEYNEYEDAMSKVKTRRLPDGSYEQYVDE